MTEQESPDSADRQDHELPVCGPGSIPRRTRTFLFTEMLVFAVLSLIASWVLSYDAILIAENPDVQLPCSINPFLNCVTVAKSWQASIFGFPNAFFGMIAEPVVMTIAVASLAGVRFPRWFMFTANVVYLLGVIFAYWLLFQSSFVIGALCPWCLLVTVSTTFVFFSMTQWNVHEGNLFLPAGWQQKLHSWLHNGWFTIAIIIWLGLVVTIEAIHWVPQFMKLL